MFRKVLPRNDDECKR